ncbi:hypothetical protein Tco_1294938 [Tanacetum coccineum]
MEAGTTSTTLTARLPILNPGEYDLWLMRIEQYFLMTDYSIWEDRRNEMKARGILLMALPNKDQLKFHSYKDAKLLMEAIEKRLQKLISQLEIQGEVITQEDMNLKLLRSIPSEWKTHALIWRNKEEIETISLDDLSRRFIKRTDRKLDVNGQRVGFDKSKVECYNSLVENKKKLEKAEKERDELKLTLEKFQNSSKSLNDLLESQVVDKFKTGIGYNTTSSTAASPAVERFVNTSEMLKNQEHNKSKSDKGYHAVPPPFTGNFVPLKPDLTFMDKIVESENLDVTIVVTPSNVKAVESNHESANAKSNGDAVEPKTVRMNSFRPPVIEDWNSDDESEIEIIPNDKTVSSSTEKIKLVKSARETVEKVETTKQNKHYPRGNQRN